MSRGGLRGRSPQGCAHPPLPPDDFNKATWRQPAPVGSSTCTPRLSREKKKKKKSANEQLSSSGHTAPSSRDRTGSRSPVGVAASPGAELCHPGHPLWGAGPCPPPLRRPTASCRPIYLRKANRGGEKCDYRAGDLGNPHPWADPSGTGCFGTRWLPCSWL